MFYQILREIMTSRNRIDLCIQIIEYLLIKEIGNIKKMSREENKMQESVANILRLELMDKCNCGSGQEVIYVCKSNQCADH
jgi:hypothetical protein